MTNNNNKETCSNLIWLDLEMSGLNQDKDKILEIATAITDNFLNIKAVGHDLVIHQSKELLDSMDQWNKKHHKKSGLIEAVLNSKINIKEAENQTLEFLKKYCPDNTGILCGNSISVDKAFLYRYMPKIYNFLNYRIIDVSSVKELVLRWYPNDPKAKFKKKEAHRSLEDIYESISELKYYKENFFK